MKRGSRTKGWGSWRRDQEQKDGALEEGIKNKRMGLLKKGSRTKGWGSCRRKGSRKKRMRLLKKISRTKAWGSGRRDQE